MRIFSPLILFTCCLCITSVARAQGCDDQSYEIQPGMCQWNDQALSEIAEAKEIAKKTAAGDPVLERIYGQYAFSTWSFITGEPSKPSYRSRYRTTMLTQFCTAEHLGLPVLDSAVQDPFKVILAELLYSDERLLGYVRHMEERMVPEQLEMKSEYCEDFNNPT